MDFLMVFGVEDWDASSSLDGKVITNAARRHLPGTLLKEVKFPKETQPTVCIAQNSERLDCEFWFIEGPLRQQGFHVVIDANATGSITGVSVTNVQRLLGRWRFEV